MDLDDDLRVKVDRPDILVEADWLRGQTPSETVEIVESIPVSLPEKGQTLANVREAFDLAPVSMNLVVDTGSLTDRDEVKTPFGLVSPVPDANGFDLGGGNPIDLMSGPLDGHPTLCDGTAAGARDVFEGVKQENFDSNRRLAWRYMVSGDAHGFSPGPGAPASSCSSGGQGEIGGNDFLTLRPDPSVFMHELGHNLNLRHGGSVDMQCKPNYLSLMNYAYDAGGLQFRRAGIGGGSDAILDYSPPRNPSGTRAELNPTLIENELDEESPIAASWPNIYVRFTDATGEPTSFLGKWQPDYNGDRAPEPFPDLLEVNINKSEEFDCDPDDEKSDDEMVDHDDWENLRIPFRRDAEYDLAAALRGPVESTDGENDPLPTWEEVIQRRELEAETGRADVSIQGSASATGNGTFDVQLTVSSKDRDGVDTPLVVLETPDGATVNDIGTDNGCSSEGGFWTCGRPMLLNRDEPYELDLEVALPAGQTSGTLGAEVSSMFNPVENDPVPEDNTVSLVLDAEGGSAPTTEDDSETVWSGETVEIDVLDNDSDADDDLDEDSLSIVLPPSLGEASVVAVDDTRIISYTAGDTSGIDTLSYQVCDETAACSTGTVTVDVIDETTCTITGTDGDDVLVGTDGDDVICGLGGNDTIDGGAGNDRLIGASGADTLEGGAGADMLLGRRGSDTLVGGDGDDELRGGRGSDVLRGGSGEDLVRGGRGQDDLRGSAGADRLFGGPGADIANGGGGADDIRGGPGQDSIDGQAGSDQLRGGRGADLLSGSNGNDRLWGGRANDTLRGGSGNNTGYGGRGTDTCTDLEVSRGCDP